MNKFQEALDELLGNAVQQQSHVGVYENSEYANINGINKMIGYSQTLQELVNIAIELIDWSEYEDNAIKPTNVLHYGSSLDMVTYEKTLLYLGDCQCGYQVLSINNYCAKCGKELDWSETTDE